MVIVVGLVLNLLAAGRFLITFFVTRKTTILAHLQRGQQDGKCDISASCKVEPINGEYRADTYQATLNWPEQKQLADLAHGWNVYNGQLEHMTYDLEWKTI